MLKILKNWVKSYLAIKGSSGFSLWIRVSETENAEFSVPSSRKAAEASAG